MATTAMPLRSPDSEDTGAPKEWFFGDEWFERDVAAVFRPRWLVAGHVDQLAEPGAYLTFSLGADECVIRRDDAGRVTAFHNVCSHRGYRLCDQRSATAPTKAIVCPYHGWTYSASDGSLRAAPHMHEDFDRSPWGLHPVHVDVWLGLIFVCFAEERPAPMAEYAGGYGFGGYDTSRFKLAAAKSHEVNANWKIVFENNWECYHCTLNHPELITSVDWQVQATEDIDALVADRVNGLEALALPTEGNYCTIHNVRVSKRPLPREDGEAEGSWTIFWEPGSGVAIAPDYAWIQAPRPTGAATTQVDQYWLVAEDAQEGVDYALETLKEYWDKTLQQDGALCENVQRGMRIPAYRPGPLNRIHQGGNAGFYAWHAEQIRRHFPEVLADGAR